jgi:ADP-ribose pyrophosphatase YjhB (NUDIX family)
MTPNSQDKKRGPLTTKLEKQILAGFSNAGLSKSWRKTMAQEIRHCHQCGETLIWQYVKVEGRNRFVCSECKFIAYQNPKIVGATLPIKNGKIYLLRRAIDPAYGLWSHPAGYMEMGETVEQAALRETWEEIRTRVRLVGPPRIYSYPDAIVVTVIYPAEVIGPTPRPGTESLEVKAFRPEEIPWNSLAFRSTFHALRDWANGRFKTRVI